MTNKKQWTHGSIVKEVKRLIRVGFNLSTICHEMQRQIPETQMNHDALLDLIKATVENYPNYHLIQKVNRSKLIINMNEKADKYYLVDPETTMVNTIHSANVKSLYYKPDFSDRIYMTEFEYNPYEFNKLYRVDNEWKFNTYEPPFWLEDFFYDKGDLENTEVPKVFHDFLIHLTDNDEASYTYVLDWLSTSLKARNYCILATIGDQGIGKGVLGSLMEKLVGTSNFSLTDNRLITKEFNSQILNKRIVYIDELKVTNTKEENRLKLLINDKVEVEGKGVDSVNTNNYASIYASSNDFDAIRLTADDRRFSIIKLTDKKLINVFDQGKISKLLSDDTVEDLANFLWHRDVKRNMSQVFLSERTEEVRESSLKDWEDWFIESYCVAHSGTERNLEVVQEDINDKYIRINPGRRAFEKLQKLYPNFFKLKKKKEKIDGKLYTTRMIDFN